MHHLHWRNILLLAVGALATLGLQARADYITPDSILRPAPANVGGADGSPITSSANVVTDQYASKGLLFPTSPGPVPGLGATAAITQVNGVNAWVPANYTEAVANRLASVNYRNLLTIRFVQPGTTTASLASSVTVEVVGGGILNAFDSHGRFLGYALSGPVGPNGGDLLTVSAGGVASFTVDGPVQPADIGLIPASPWGVADVSFTPSAAPEPAGLVLACLGMLGLAIRRRLTLGLP